MPVQARVGGREGHMLRLPVSHVHVSDSRLTGRVHDKVEDVGDDGTGSHPRLRVFLVGRNVQIATIVQYHADVKSAAHVVKGRRAVNWEIGGFPSVREPDPEYPSRQHKQVLASNHKPTSMHQRQSRWQC
jgi:hypothetical protein